jgi:hypothetical protein
MPTSEAKPAKRYRLFFNHKERKEHKGKIYFQKSMRPLRSLRLNFSPVKISAT